jgi:hypothetical protein
MACEPKWRPLWADARKAQASFEASMGALMKALPPSMNEHLGKFAEIQKSLALLNDDLQAGLEVLPKSLKPPQSPPAKHTLGVPTQSIAPRIMGSPSVLPLPETPPLEHLDWNEHAYPTRLMRAQSAGARAVRASLGEEHGVTGERPAASLKCVPRTLTFGQSARRHGGGTSAMSEQDEDR